jgi:hypothetical protein
MLVALQLLQGQLQLLHQLRRQNPQLLQQPVSPPCEQTQGNFSPVVVHSFLRETQDKDEVFPNRRRGNGKAQNAVFVYFSKCR